MSYEDMLIQEANGERDCDDRCRWCADCERHAEDCVCEELSEHFNSINPASFDQAHGLRPIEPL